MAEKILIVDDTPANLGVLVETLGAAGYELMVAEDGEEALAQTAEIVPDLILLDVMMPGLDGFETCRRLKAQATTADVPVLFMTALNETQDKVRAFSSGGVDYLTKPIEHEEALARVRTHLALRRYQRELAEQLTRKENFMRIASHDLRNPVCLILFATELARRQEEIPESVRKQLESIGESAAQIRRIIDTFLGLTLTCPEGETSGRVDLALLGDAVVRQHRPAAERKNIRLIAPSAPDALPNVRCDATLTYQVIANLVSNALKFTPPGGRVALHASVANDKVRLAVADSGPGVPADERARLFAAGAKLSPRPTAGEESHGLGLPIVKQLVESQGGSVGAEFPADGGSVFWFELPAAD
ncbi:MAG: hybrid sensor histidine kinase/response regulator [Opitutus sp.]|nr:hybrid sensor histidine kinase/response regulator [Opitutus sp.]